MCYNGSVLERLKYDDFLPLKGTSFRIAEGDRQYELRLVSIGKVMESEAARLTRSAFSLFFLGPPEPYLPQQIYALEHETLGRLEIFIVPVGRDPQGYLYEAVFT